MLCRMYLANNIKGKVLHELYYVVDSLISGEAYNSIMFMVVM